MKTLYIPLTILASSFAYDFNGQVTTQALIIEGQVYDEYKKYGLIENATLQLFSSEGIWRETTTDSNGHYTFVIDQECHVIRLVLTADKRAFIRGQKDLKFCQKKQEQEFAITDSTRHITADFQLRPLFHCELLFPNFHFKPNSISSNILYSDSNFNSTEDSIPILPENKFQLVADELKVNEDIVIELTGHCSEDESNIDQLSWQRAETIKQELIQRGVDARRLVVKGDAASHPFIKSDMIRNAHSKREREALRARNRRVTIRIIDWDNDKQ